MKQGIITKNVRGRRGVGHGRIVGGLRRQQR